MGNPQGIDFLKPLHENLTQTSTIEKRGAYGDLGRNMYLSLILIHSKITREATSVLYVQYE